MRIRQAQIIALTVIFATYPVLLLGQQGYESVGGITDKPGQQWLDADMERAEGTVSIYCLLALMAGVARGTKILKKVRGVFPFTELNTEPSRF